MSFICDENGNLRKLDSTGRMRKHWKTSFRKQARKHQKDSCEECGSKENLTIHHEPPLRETLKTKKFITLCEKCHEEKECEQK